MRRGRADAGGMTAYCGIDGMVPVRENFRIMETTKFTLRFENPGTHELLRLLAGRWGVSMNRLAEDILERELRIGALLEEAAILETLALLRRYRPERDLEGDIAAIARAEVTVDDPAEGRMVDAQAVGDPYGIAAAFAS
jgi:hypothetical protein